MIWRPKQSPDASLKVLKEAHKNKRLGVLIQLIEAIGMTRALFDSG
jgi:hypothetical protein